MNHDEKFQLTISNTILIQLVKEAGLSAMDEGKFQLYSLAHYIPGALLMLAWASLLVHCIWPIDALPDILAVAAKEKSN